MDAPLASLPATICSRLLLKQLALCGIHTRQAVIKQNGITPPGVTTTAFQKLCNFLRSSENVFSPTSMLSSFAVPPQSLTPTVTATATSGLLSTPMASSTASAPVRTPPPAPRPYFSLTEHTWWGKRVHYIHRTRQTVRSEIGTTPVRIKRRLYRGVLGELCVSDRGVIVYVKDAVTGVVQKEQSPALIVALQRLWHQCDIVSEDHRSSVEDLKEHEPHSLPCLKIHTWPPHLSTAVVTLLRYTIKETNDLLCLAVTT